MGGGLLSEVEHGVYFGFGEGLGQDFPCLGRLDIQRGVVVDALVEEEPFVESANAAEFAGGGAGINSVGAEVFEEGGYVLLEGVEEDAVAFFEEFGKGVEVAVVGFAGEGAEAFFYAQVDSVFTKEAEIARSIHNADYRPVGG